MSFYRITSRTVERDENNWNGMIEGEYESYTQALRHFLKNHDKVQNIHWSEREQENGIEFETTEWELDRIETNEDDEEIEVICYETFRTTKVYKDVKEYIDELRFGIEAKNSKEYSDKINELIKDYDYWIEKIKNETSCDYLITERR